METNFFGVGQTTIAFLPLVCKATNAVILNVTIDMAIKSGWHIARCTIEYEERARYFIYQCVSAGIESRRHQREHSVTPGLFTATKLNHPGCKTMKAGAEPLLPWTYCWIRMDLLVSVKLNLLNLLEILPDKMDC